MFIRVTSLHKENSLNEVSFRYTLIKNLCSEAIKRKLRSTDFSLFCLLKVKS